LRELTPAGDTSKPGIDRTFIYHVYIKMQSFGALCLFAVTVHLITIISRLFLSIVHVSHSLRCGHSIDGD
jgi:uncharacterized membrane protein